MEIFLYLHYWRFISKKTLVPMCPPIALSRTHMDRQRFDRNSKQFAGRVELKPLDLYRLDCKLARSVFVAAVSYGYHEYMDKILDC